MPKINQEITCFAGQSGEYTRSFQILISSLNMLKLCILFCCVGLHKFEKVESRGKLMKLGTNT